jgi:hypothetical protein
MSAKRITEDYLEITGNRLSATSLLKMFPIMEDDDGTKFMNIFRSYTVFTDTLVDTSYFQTYEMENEDWWETVSWKMYDDVVFWWIVCMSNNVVNPFEESDPGKNILVLSPTYVGQLIKEIRNISEL